MFLECSECQAVTVAPRPPSVCPRCGLAGAKFSAIAEADLAAYLAGGQQPWVAPMTYSPAWSLDQDGQREWPASDQARG